MGNDCGCARNENEHATVSGSEQRTADVQDDEDFELEPASAMLPVQAEQKEIRVDSRTRGANASGAVRRANPTGADASSEHAAWFSGQPAVNATDVEIADWFRGQPAVNASEDQQGESNAAVEEATKTIQLLQDEIIKAKAKREGAAVWARQLLDALTQQEQAGEIDPAEVVLEEHMSSRRGEEPVKHMSVLHKELFNAEQKVDSCDQWVAQLEMDLQKYKEQLGLNGVTSSPPPNTPNQTPE